MVSGRIMTGLASLDELMGGFGPGELILIAAHSSHGKTAMAKDIVLHAAMHAKHRTPTAFFCLEISKDSMLTWFLLSETGINLSDRVPRGKWKELEGISTGLSGAPVYIDDASGLTAQEVESRCQKLVTEIPDLGLVVLDYLQLLRGEPRGSHRRDEIGQITRDLKALAVHLDVPIVLFSRLPSPPRRPTIEDIDEVGIPRENIDSVVLLYRRASGVRHDSKGRRIQKKDSTIQPIEEAEAIVVKNTRGETGVARVRFNPNIARFESLPEGLTH